MDSTPVGLACPGLQLVWSGTAEAQNMPYNHGTPASIN